MKRLALTLGVVALGLYGLAVPQAAVATPPSPLVSCRDMTGDGLIRVNDILAVVSQFGRNQGDLNYYPLYDVTADGHQTVADILAVVAKFHIDCPVGGVDTQVTLATLAILNDPQRAQFISENPAFLAGRGYFRASTDVPGQGVHYFKPTFDDGQFNPTQPKSLVYHGGRLVAQVYYAEGDIVTWGPIDPPPADNVQIDAFCVPSAPSTSCSWSGTQDTWHWHDGLCTWGMGTTSAVALPGVANATLCQQTAASFGFGGTGQWFWQDRSGWMGHLWNHKLNPNGRFADCSPDETGNWGPFDCPQ